MKRVTPHVHHSKKFNNGKIKLNTILSILINRHVGARRLTFKLRMRQVIGYTVYSTQIKRERDREKEIRVMWY